MKEVVIVSACRTAIGAFGGTLKDMNGPRIAETAMREAITRAGIEPAMIDDVRFGSCVEHMDALNVARVAALMAGIPDTVTAVTINRVCISGMEAVISGMAMIQADMAEIILAGGVEHMSGVPYVVPGARWGCRLQDGVFVDAMIHALHCGSHLIPHPEDGPVKQGMPLDLFKGKPYIMGHTAEFVAQLHNISREEMDEVALRSHNSTERATLNGDFKEEIVPVEVPQRKGQPPLIFDTRRALPARLDHGGSGQAAAGLRPQDRQGHGREFLRHQRRRQRHDHHVGGQGPGTGPETPWPGSGASAAEPATPR